MHVTIRADGDGDIGYGHLVRTGAVADVLLERGHEVTYATTTPAQVRDSCPAGVETCELPAREDPAPFRRWLDGSTVDVVYADAYPVGTDYQRTVREEYLLVIQVDDAREAVCADAVVNGNLYADDLEYEFVGEEPTWWLGPDYLPLRREIREFAAREPPWRDPPERAIVTFGGSDPSGLTPAAVRAFDGLGLRVDAVVGPGASASLEAEVREVAAETDADVRVVRDPPDLVERMFEADLAVTACGSTTYELLALGTPMVAVPVVANQEPIGRSLRERALATVVDTPITSGELAQAIESLLDGPALRERYVGRGSEIVDGSGADRIANVLLSHSGRRTDHER